MSEQRPSRLEKLADDLLCFRKIGRTSQRLFWARRGHLVVIHDINCASMEKMARGRHEPAPSGLEIRPS